MFTTIFMLTGEKALVAHSPWQNCAGARVFGPRDEHKATTAVSRNKKPVRNFLILCLENKITQKLMCV